jgi:hypothetical protein
MYFLDTGTGERSQLLAPEIGPGLMSDIMNELKLTREEFLDLLQNPKKYASKARSQ